MPERQIAQLKQRLEYLRAENDEFATALNVVRPLLAGRVSHAERQLLRRAMAKKKSPLRTQIWRFLLGEAESLKQGHLDLGR